MNLQRIVKRRRLPFVGEQLIFRKDYKPDLPFCMVGEMKPFLGTTVTIKTLTQFADDKWTAIFIEEDHACPWCYSLPMFQEHLAAEKYSSERDYLENN